MSGNRVDKYDPHCVFKMECRACHHRWVAVAPLGVDDENMECPNCGHMTGEAYLGDHDPRTGPWDIDY
jgi:hypothetical protein